MATRGPEASGQVGSAFQSREAAATWQRGAAARAERLGAATELMLDLAGVGPGRRVLDVAAGTGEQTLLAARRVGPAGRVLATDISAEMLAAALAAAQEAGLPNVSTRVSDAERLELAGDSFDAAICRLGLMLMSHPDRACAAVRRALVPGARFAAAVFAPAARNPLLALPLEVARRVGWLPAPGPGEPGMFALGGPGLLEGAYRAAGFRDVAVHAVSAPNRFASAAAAVAALQQGSVALQRLTAPLSEAQREAVWEAIEQELRQFEGQSGCETPGEVLVGVGTK
jgi:SAM-dependent methyltransferase